MSELHIEGWRVLKATVHDTETNHDTPAVIVMPVERAGSTDCVLCKHGVCTPTWDRSREPWRITHGRAQA